MLGKLLKYDMKRQMKLLAAAYLVVGLTAGISAISTQICKSFEDTIGVLQVVNISTTGLAILAVVAMVAATFIYAVLFFRKNLFKDEGYLMHTLPVKPWQLYVSKLVTGTLCCYLSILVAIAALCLANLHIPDFISGMTDAGAPNWFIGETVFTVALAIPTGLIQFYVSLAFGYTLRTNMKTPVNKDLLSVVSYIVVYMVQQVLGIGIIFVWAVINMRKITDSVLDSSMPAAAGAGAFVEEMFWMMGGLYGISIALMLIFAVGMSVLSVWRMSRHLNLN